MLVIPRVDAFDLPAEVDVERWWKISPINQDGKEEHLDDRRPRETFLVPGDELDR
jgi:hypothetical protein